MRSISWGGNVPDITPPLRISIVSVSRLEVAEVFLEVEVEADVELELEKKIKKELPEPDVIIVAPIEEPPYTPPSYGGGGGGGGGSIYREYDTLDRQNLADGGMGRERIEFQ